MIRQPTYAGNVQEKDELDILHWALNKSISERLSESWRLNCINHGIPLNSSINKTVSTATKRSNND
jgi:hypothetical protein